MKKILLATVAAIGFAGAASAADLAVSPAPVYAPAFNWSGCYLGGFVGGAWNAENVKVLDVNGYNFGFPLDNWSYDTDSSFIGGGTVGCNWQPVGSSYVIGLEGEIGGIDLKGTGYDPYDFASSISATTKIGDWYGMITGRLGYAWDRVLVYAKGGAAFLDVETTVTDPLVNPGFLATNKKSVATWTVGGGLEYAFNWNWSLKAEYMFIGLDNYNACGVSTGVGGFGPGTYCWNSNFEGIHSAKIGLNYRFGAGAPVVARY